MPLDDLLITKAEITDAPLLTSLGITTFLEAFAADNRKEDMDKYIAEEMNIGKITEELNDKENLFFLAWWNDVLVGYSNMRAIKIPEQLKGRKPIELERLYVLKEHHEKKIGAALLNTCLTHAITHKFDTIWLGVWEHNYRAVNFYKKWGFEFFGSHHFKLGDDIQTDQLMKKEL